MIPPGGAEPRVDAAAHAFLVEVQAALGTANKGSVMLVAIAGLARVASRFDVGTLEIVGALDQARRLLLAPRRTS